MCFSPKITVSEQWITQSEQILKKMDQNIKKAEKDRLEAITAILYVINAIDRSLHGWRRWVQNLGFMAQFSSEELHQMEQGLSQVARAFIENDIDVTKRFAEKIPQSRFRIRQQRPSTDTSSIVA
jgi:hypothetical protein